MSTHNPLLKSFKYILVPADDAKSVVELRHEGESDDAFRASIKQHFHRQLLSEPQKAEMAKHLSEKAKSNTNAAQAGADDAATSTTAAAATVSGAQQEQMIAEYLDQTSFEIVPIVMPGRQNRFIGTSIYVDDSGRFKDLSLNNRASKIAQRDIRGDAFLLSNHDDPALDEWSRVDCTLADYEFLLEKPPTTQYDASNRAQMASAALLRERDTKRISDDEVEKAIQAKTDGNAFFSAGDLKAAVQAYSEVVDLTEGRRDLLSNELEVTALRVAALLNRSLVQNRLGKNDEAAVDARTAIELDGNNIKAHYRLAAALCDNRDFNGAEKALATCEQIGGTTGEVTTLRDAVAEGRKRLRQEEKQKYSKLFV